MQHDDRPARAAAVGFGVDGEERVAAGIEVYRLAVEDRVDDFRFEPTLPLQILGGCRKREDHGADHPTGEQQGRDPARPRGFAAGFSPHPSHV